MSHYSNKVMKILITGIHGFVGSNLVEYLKGDNEIYGLDIVAPDKEGLVKTYSWDDIDMGKVPAIDAIIHLAGKAHDTKNKSAADVYFKVNTELTQKIFDYFLTSGAKMFIFFSTAKAAADRVDRVLTEDVVPSPVGPYGESKIKAEEYILSKELSSDKSVYIFRPCMIHVQAIRVTLIYFIILFVKVSLGHWERLRIVAHLHQLIMFALL